MSTLVRLTLACLAATAPLACAQQPGGSPVGTAAVAPAEPGKGRGVVTGVARGPKFLVGRVLPTGGGHVLPTGGGNVLPTGGGNVVPTGGGNLAAAFGLQAVTEAPIAGAKAYLADAAGQPFPTLAAVETDAEGRFTFPAVPAGHTFMVVVDVRDTARAKDATLQTLVRSSELGASTTIDAATSLVTLAVTEGQGGALGDLNPSTFRTATEAAARHLMDADLPDLSDRSAMLAKISSLENSIAELKSALEEIRQDLKDIKASLEEIKSQVAGRPIGAPDPGMVKNTNGTGARAGDCGGTGTFKFALKKAYDRYPVRVDFVSPYGHHKGQLIFTARGDEPSLTLPYGCPHAITLRDADGKTLANDPAYSVPLDAKTRVELPF